MNNQNEPGVSKLELFQQSKLSLMDFNVEESIKNLEICLNVGRENIRRKRTENCTVLSALPCSPPIASTANCNAARISSAWLN